MALYKGETLLAGSGAGFMSESEGVTGQVLKKTETGYRWDDVAEGGEEGQVLMKTENGYAWCDAPGGIKYGFIDLLVVAGGGGGGGRGSGGGGGGGGFIECRAFSINSETLSYNIVIGKGGCGSCNDQGNANGGDSCFWTIKACGGGGGGGLTGTACGAYSGGSGGGGKGCCSVYGTCPGSGISGQGYGGGQGATLNNYPGGGGGGGAGGAGGYPGGTSKGGNGGNGKCSDISGTNTRYSGGGGGSGCYNNSDCLGQAGCGGAAYGCKGGGGNAFCCNGCPGVVILRYHTDGSDGIKNTSSGGFKYTCGDYTIHCFTSCTDVFNPVFK